MANIKRDIKLIVVDLDGTLLNSKHELSDRNRDVLKKAQDAGIQVVLATGKTRKSAEPIIEALGLKTPGVYVQGLMIYNADGNLQKQQLLDSDVARKIIQYTEAAGFDVILYAGNRLLVRRNEEPVSEIATYGEPEPEGVGSLVNIVADTKINKIMAIGTNKRKINALRWQLDQQVGDQVSFTNAAQMISLEILPKGASKANGVRNLMKMMGINSENVMAIGDADNDISLLEMVGFGVAVGNANDKVKAAADEVVASNDDDGVAEAVEKFVLPDEPKAGAKADSASEAKSDADANEKDAAAESTSDKESEEKSE